MCLNMMLRVNDNFFFSTPHVYLLPRVNDNFFFSTHHVYLLPRVNDNFFFFNTTRIFDASDCDLAGYFDLVHFVS